MSDLIDTSAKFPQELAISKEDVITREMGLQAIREILQKMPDMEAKISVVREVMSTF